MISETGQTPPLLDVVAVQVDGEYSYARSVSTAIRSMERVIAGIAATDIPVLIVGESGTGKQIVATEIHRLSRRRNEPFVHVNCSALNLAGLNDWLQRVNSGTGDPSPWPALSGTVFFDEINSMDLGCQTRLLPALSAENKFPGGLGVRFRPISAASCVLEEEMRARRFREELYYRINGACLRLPPLRQRKEDIPGLVDHFLQRYAIAFGRPRRKVSGRTLQILADYSWPGNIRELENVVKKIVALDDEEIGVADIHQPGSELASDINADLGISLKQASRKASHEAERELILKTLGRVQWNRKRAAQTLGISYKALLYKLKQIGLEDSGTT
jgi:two-component system response regulator AtoC